MDLYIGTFNDHIYRATLNTETGEITDVKQDAAVPRPGFLALHPHKTGPLFCHARRRSRWHHHSHH